ncbi:MAG: molecular chaperone DnaJ [Gammaproteobacteria bacterium SG8_47]|nr:MAG: molecular chaperone DnaJ [Gammaproteobacteria bacterium SG8_47]
MSWWGKLVGGTFGFVLGGPLGAALGAVLGHQFDRGMRQIATHGGRAEAVGSRERTQTAFFTATFSIMGHLAKADGRVSESEISFARAVMDQMALDSEQRTLAIKLFNAGKQADFPFDEALDQFRRECHRRHTLMQMFLEIQLQAAYADGQLHTHERARLVHMFERLGFSHREFEHLDALVRAARHFGRRTYGERGHPRQPSAQTLVNEAYEVLGVSPQADDATVKRAYRRLMNQHHPDKLVAKGMPEEMVKLATEKTQEIKAAYDRIREVRAAR